MVARFFRSNAVLMALMLWIGACASERSVQQTSEPAVLPELVPGARFGCVECEGLEQLTPVAIGLGEDGRVYELDQYEPHVRMFDADGNLAATFGRSGQGPGEIQFPVAVFPGDDGEVLVYDLPGLHVFDAKGEHLRTMPWPMRVPHSFDYLANEHSLLMLSFLPRMPEARDGRSKALERWLLEGEAIEPEIVIAPQDLPADPSDATRSRVTALAFRSDGGFVLGDRWSYRLYAYDAAGEPIGEFGREIPRQSKSQQQREREREKVDRSGGRLTLQPDMNHFQQWSLKFDCQGRLWVLTTRGGPDRSAIDLFDSDRRYLGEIQVAQHIVQGGPMFELAGGRLAAVVEDDDGIQTVQVWRVKG